MTTESRVIAPAPSEVHAWPSRFASAAPWSIPVCGGQGVVVVPEMPSGGVVGGVVKQTSPLMSVCGDVLEVVNVLETMP